MTDTRDQLVAQLSAMPALPFVTEAWEGEGEAPQLVMRRTLVRPGEPDWPHALAQNLDRLAPPGLGQVRPPDQAHSDA